MFNEHFVHIQEARVFIHLQGYFLFKHKKFNYCSKFGTGSYKATDYEKKKLRETDQTKWLTWKGSKGYYVPGLWCYYIFFYSKCVNS